MIRWAGTAIASILSVNAPSTPATDEYQVPAEQGSATVPETSVLFSSSP
jgi:hypothetical protein